MVRQDVAYIAFHCKYAIHVIPFDLSNGETGRSIQWLPLQRCYPYDIHMTWMMFHCKDAIHMIPYDLDDVSTTYVHHVQRCYKTSVGASLATQINRRSPSRTQHVHAYACARVCVCVFMCVSARACVRVC
jgi:hypothetical protein